MTENEVVARASMKLTAVQFQQLADVPPALTWFANIDNPQTRRAYQNDLQEFIAFIVLNGDNFESWYRLRKFWVHVIHLYYCASRVLPVCFAV